MIECDDAVTSGSSTLEIKINVYHNNLLLLYLLLEKKKKTTRESEYEMRARLDNRIERARARHELARLVMETILLVYVYGILMFSRVCSRMM